MNQLFERSNNNVFMKNKRVEQAGQIQIDNRIMKTGKIEIKNNKGRLNQN